ncbi:hypothetical protein LX32DRAFT_320694 [Colletotrichum zoysiae]|uniref:NACHT domain-containing protein n=1 Tax=Colletotrichum zoysiae TaxID=1216348 RepID=A0AAD9M694_9PEZI|nr:hypothetical protein LX32DRAFT_320694 [Colletotrichum zoysiae]
MDPVSAVGLASSILTFLDIGYKVVSGILETADKGQTSMTENMSSVVGDLHNAVAAFSSPVLSTASENEQALGEISVKCRALSTELLDLLETLKVSQPGMSWDAVRVTLRRIRKTPKVQELQSYLVEYRSQILLRLISILGDRQLATQVQLSNSFGSFRSDLNNVRDALEDVRHEVLGRLEQTLQNTHSTPGAQPGNDPYAPERSRLLAEQHDLVRQIRDVLDGLTSTQSGKTPEMHILEQVYFPAMFEREDTLKQADESTFRWFVEGLPAVESEKGSGTESDKPVQEAADGHSIKSHAYATRAEASSRFTRWLRSESGIFHISGKAGSGKSTLMKLIVSTGRTHDLVKEWAGQSRLLFARFYFWSSGHLLQNSLEGLYRSILFEILIQRPGLVREVFPEAYDMVTRSPWSSPFHDYSRHFAASGFKSAFGRLLRLPSDPAYRLCIFIDGLDEYGADPLSGELPESQREELAGFLSQWSSQGNVKILVSSRPHEEFLVTFPEDKRIHLHHLTLSDMIKFGNHLFERHRVFKTHGVQEYYRPLVERVAKASDGVFLWTGLTIQSLLRSVSRRDKLEALEKQLDETPSELHKLYDKMFQSIDGLDQDRAMKMMLLVAQEQKCLGKLSHPRGINAMAIYWLDDLEDPDFPANQPFTLWDDAKIEDQRQFAVSQVDGYTKGLLEVVSHKPDMFGPYPEPPHMRHTVKFFHRTASDYVCSSSLARQVLSSSPKLFTLEYYIRLALAELHFGSLRNPDIPRRKRIIFGRWPQFERYPELLKKYISTQKPLISLIEAYKLAFEQQAKYLAWRRFWINLSHFGHLPQLHPSTSFDHWMAHDVREAYVVEYLAEKGKTFPSLLHPRVDLSLLLSAACSNPSEKSDYYSPVPLVRTLLELGANPLDLVYQKIGMDLAKDVHVAINVWQAWCIYYISFIIDRMALDLKDFPVLHEILELFLERGVDADCVILLRDRFRPRTTFQEEKEENKKKQKGVEEEVEEEQVLNVKLLTIKVRARRTAAWLETYHKRSMSAYAITLKDFVREVNPPNYERLNQLLERNSRTRPVIDYQEIDAELAAEHSVNFSKPSVGPFSLEKVEDGRRLVVQWVRWNDAEIPGSLCIRTY